MNVRRVEIKSLATYVPPRLLTNADLEKMVETTDEWIMQRTGIRERHIVDPGVATSDLATEAAREAISESGPDARRHRLDHRRHGHARHAVPEHRVPGAAQDRRAARRGASICRRRARRSPTALTVGSQIVAAGGAKYVLVIGADVMSSIIDYTDRATCVLFGDGAGAVVLGPSADDEHRHPRLRAQDRRQRRPGAVHAGRRQQAAGVARDRR